MPKAQALELAEDITAADQLTKTGTFSWVTSVAQCHLGPFPVEKGHGRTQSGRHDVEKTHRPAWL